MRKVPKRRLFDHLCINYCLLSELFVTLLKIKIKNPQHIFTLTPIKKFRNFLPKKKEKIKENMFVSSLSNPSVWFLLTTTQRLLLQTQSSDLRKVLLKKFCDIKFGSHTTTGIFP